RDVRVRWRLRGLTISSAAERMCLGVEDDPLEVDGAVRSEQQVEVLEGLGEEEARHRVAALLRHDVLQRRVARFRPTELDEVVEEATPHLEPAWISRALVEVIG